MSSVKAFIDTGGFFALATPRSAHHEKAVAWMEEARRLKWRALTSDYILDETATLFRARGLYHRVSDIFDLAEKSAALETVRVDPETFQESKAFFLKHRDQEFSFTDCTSFVLMRRWKLRQALATDAHFRSAGFDPILVD